MKEYLLTFWYLHLVTLAGMAVLGYVAYSTFEIAPQIAAGACGYFVWLAWMVGRYYRRWVA